MSTPLVMKEHESSVAINGQSITADFNSNSADKVDDIIKESDKLHDDHKYEELFSLLSQYKHLEHAELLWRLARVYCVWAKIQDEKGHHHKKKELMEEGFTFVQRALKLDDTNFHCQSWYATMVHYTSEQHGYRAHFNNAFLIRDHYEKAVSLNPDDAVSLHSLGYWCFAFANLPWYQKKILSVLFHSPPETTYEQALEYFNRAEEASPGFFSMNLVMAGRAHYHLHQYSKARELFTRASEMTVQSPDDRQNARCIVSFYCALEGVEYQQSGFKGH